MSILKNINTELRNPKSFSIDQMTSHEAVSLMIEEEYSVN